MPRPAHHAPEHQALVVNLPGGAANRLLHADRGRFQGAILGLMWLELLSVNPQSFHWTMDLSLPTGRLLALGAAVVLAGTLTAWLSARAAAGRDAVMAVKEDW